MKTLGYILLAIGIFIGAFALTMDTSVPTNSSSDSSPESSTRVNNLGLMSDRQNYLILSGILVLVGVALILFSKHQETEINGTLSKDSSPTAISSNSTKYENLEKIGSLLEKGIITKDEFEVEKQKIMIGIENIKEIVEPAKEKIITPEETLKCERIQVEIKKTKPTLFSGFNKELVEVLSAICTDEIHAINLLDNYKRIYKSDLVTAITGLTSKYDSIKEYLAPLIDKGIIESTYPHNRIK